MTTNNETTAAGWRTADVLATLAKQHADILHACARIGSTRAEAEQFCAALAAHLAFEEAVVGPSVRRAIDSPALDDLEVEHEIERELVRQLWSMDDAGPMFAATLRVLARQVRAHIEAEESLLLPRLASAGVDDGPLAWRLVEGRASQSPAASSSRFIHPRIAQRLVPGAESPAAFRSDRRTDNEPAPSRTFYDRLADLDRHWGRIADG